MLNYMHPCEDEENCQLISIVDNEYERKFRYLLDIEYTNLFNWNIKIRKLIIVEKFIDMKH